MRRWSIVALTLPCLLSCMRGERATTYADLCRTEMTVPLVPPDTAISMRDLERALAESLSARDRRAERTGDSVTTLPYELLGFLERWPYRNRIEVSRADMFAALMLAELRGLYPGYTLGWLADHLAQEQDGPERLWSLLALPASECRMAACRVGLVGAVVNVQLPRGAVPPDQAQSPLYRAAFCRLAEFYSDSTWPIQPRDSLGLGEFNAAVVVGAHLLERLEHSGVHSDTVFVRGVVRAGQSGGRFGQRIARGFPARPE